MAIGPSMFSSAIAMRSHSSSTEAGETAVIGSAASRSNASRASASNWRQAASSVTASRMGSVILGTGTPAAGRDPGRPWRYYGPQPLADQTANREQGEEN